MTRLFLVFFIFSVLISEMPSSSYAANSNRRGAAVGICGAALLFLGGWAWWNDYIRFPGESLQTEASEGAQLQIEVQQKQSFGVDRYEVTGSSLGDLEIKEEAFTWGTTLNLNSSSGGLSATGKRDATPFSPKIVVEDASGQKIGSLKRDFSQFGSSLGTVYSILDSNDNVIASSDRVQGFVKHFVLTSSDGSIVAQIDKNFNGVFDRWTINIYDPTAIDERLVILLPAFQSSK